MQSNQHYFKISQDNPEPHLDKNYFILEKNPKLMEHIKNIKEIKEILITIKKLKENQENETVLEKYFNRLFLIFNSSYANCSELGCFVNACDTTRDLIQKDYKSFKIITNLYIANREIDDKVPENWVQAIIDSNSSRKKGELGERKLIRIMIENCFIEVGSWSDFKKNRKCVARFSKDIFSNAKVEENIGVMIKTKKQDKMLDLIIKNNGRIFLLEAKHLNVGGGEQDKQISELIEILNLKVQNKKVYFVSFLDGTYSNNLLGIISKKSKKKIKQQKEIKKYLKHNPQNFWMNTAGFSEFVKDMS
jgi:hypothetical protein